MHNVWAWTTAGSTLSVHGARFSLLGDEPGDEAGPWDELSLHSQ